MNFKLTPQQEALQQKLRTFAESKIAPIAFQLDQENRFPEEIVKELGQMGILGIPFPTEYGGAGMDALSYAIAVEELSRVDAGTGVILSAHVSLGSWPIYAYGSEAQKEKYLKPMASGKKLGAFGLTEPNAGSDASGTETTAVLDGEHYILNGTKIFITNAGYADTYVIFALTTPGIGSRGISAFIVEKDFPGFTIEPHYDKMGIRSSATAQLTFKDVKVPKDNLLGKEGEGFVIAMKTLEGGRIGIAAQALGIAQGAYEQALLYAKERVQFGKPIGKQQAVAFKIADMATKIRAARFLVYSAAELKENHESYGVESAMAKQYASDICLEVVNDAVQIYGGSGFLKGFAVERMYRDAKITTIYEGTNEIQRVVISAALLGKDKKSAAPVSKPVEANQGRKKVRLDGATPAKKAEALLEALKKDGLSPSAIYQGDHTIAGSDRVISVGMGLEKDTDMIMIRTLAEAMGAEVGSSRPAAEWKKYVPLDHFVGLSGQKFKGNLYLAVGISGQSQHLAGIKDAKTVIAINSDPAAPIFEHADYYIVDDLYKIVPEIIKMLL